jgi:hypothetical protein
MVRAVLQAAEENKRGKVSVKAVILWWCGWRTADATLIAFKLRWYKTPRDGEGEGKGGGASGDKVDYKEKERQNNNKKEKQR